MFLLILIAVIALIVLAKMGIFRKAKTCPSCGTTVKGTEQTVFEGRNPFVLCKNCAGKIHPQILDYAKKNWEIEDYKDYIAWEEATKEERSHFDPDVNKTYNVKIDTRHNLFALGSGKKGGMVFRFADLLNYELKFAAEKVEEGFFSDTVRGNELITVELDVPNVYLEEVVTWNTDMKLKKKGTYSPKYEYVYTPDFTEIVIAFKDCVRKEEERRAAAAGQPASELEKAMALFMLDGSEEITQEILKKQRNKLIKAFHPDNAEESETYAQKINAAYELLSGIVKK